MIGPHIWKVYISIPCEPPQEYKWFLIAFHSNDLVKLIKAWETGWRVLLASNHGMGHHAPVIQNIHYVGQVGQPD